MNTNLSLQTAKEQKKILIYSQRQTEVQQNKFELQLKLAKGKAEGCDSMCDKLGKHISLNPEPECLGYYIRR